MPRRFHSLLAQRLFCRFLCDRPKMSERKTTKYSLSLLLQKNGSLIKQNGVVKFLKLSKDWRLTLTLERVLLVRMKVSSILLLASPSFRVSPLAACRLMLYGTFAHRPLSRCKARAGSFVWFGFGSLSRLEKLRGILNQQF